jgi:hypothetical protein
VLERHSEKDFSFPEMSNAVSPPAEPGVYPKEITRKPTGQEARPILKTGLRFAKVKPVKLNIGWKSSSNPVGSLGSKYKKNTKNAARSLPSSQPLGKNVSKCK